MVATTDPSLGHLAPGDHVCWVVDDPATALAAAAAIAAAGAQHRQKTLAFGPAESPLRNALEGKVSFAADPWTDILGGRFDPQAMYEMFREQTAGAAAEGYDGLRLVADMDWLLPGKLPTSEVVAFELMLDCVVKELGATVVCAYRRASFDDDARAAMSCVHPINVGVSVDPQFQIVAADADTWRLTGEVDLAVADVFAHAISSAVSSKACRLDVSRLDFIDVAGTRALAHAVSASGQRVTVVGDCVTLQRCWVVLGFDAVAPSVTFETLRTDFGGN